MNEVKLYRKRLIPQECILLKDDLILYKDSSVIITSWNSIRPKKDLHHGFSCYFMDRGYKISKFCDKQDQLLYWYCDIIEYTYDACGQAYIFTDLLADVIIYPDGRVRVVDLEELSDALDQELIDIETMKRALRQLNDLLTIIYRYDFSQFSEYSDVLNCFREIGESFQS